MYLSTIAHNIVSLLLAAIWAVGSIILHFRTRAEQVAYLRRFPPVNGVPHDMAVSGNPFGVVARSICRVMRKRQPDPDLEQLRREFWRRFRYSATWMY